MIGLSTNFFSSLCSAFEGCFCCCCCLELDIWNGIESKLDVWAIKKWWWKFIIENGFFISFQKRNENPFSIHSHQNEWCDDDDDEIDVN